LREAPRGQGLLRRCRPTGMRQHRLKAIALRRALARGRGRLAPPNHRAKSRRAQLAGDDPGYLQPPTATARTSRNPMSQNLDAGNPVSSSDRSCRENACWSLFRISLNVRGVTSHTGETYPSGIISDDSPSRRCVVLDLCAPRVLAPYPNPR
jgi:hypothetical protein